MATATARPRADRTNTTTITTTTMTGMGTTTDPALILHQWLSPAFPVGAFAYSHGLEWDVAAGRVTDAAAFADWLDTVLEHGSGRNDAILLAAAYRADDAALDGIAELADALAPSSERREETLAQGRAFAATAAALHGIDLAPMAYPVVVGRAARLLELPLDLTLRLFVQAFAASITSAAIRLIPLGQTDGQRVLALASPRIEDLATQAVPGDVEAVGGAVPLIDIASMRHERQGTRLFRS
ncbi:urease accessory protein UreF [Pseudooceanicola sp. LIPI14-2-Ac024]|uniref:urease accessory protein UreF n=1 Tax=Pseudooceanicola sp. LIPI14-2-Ac024 TaxID=3344875 RepID=UPI0035D000AA